MEFPASKGVSAKWVILFVCLLSSSQPANVSGSSPRILVCYYANWAVYRPGLAKFTPENIDPHLCSHLVYAFAGMNKNYELKPFDSYNDVQLGNFKKFTGLKSHNPQLKTMIAVGGWNEGSKRFSKMVESSEARGRFVRGALSFLRKHNFDGLDLDWEYPGSRDGGRESDKEGYATLVKELREAFDSESKSSGRSRLLLTMAVPAGKEYIDKGYDVPTLARHLDFLNLLTYDYHTGHEATVNHHAPLREEPGLEEWSPNKLLNVEWTVHYYVQLGCDPGKLVLGVPTYGRSFTLEDPEETDLGAPATGPGEKGEATREAGYLAYYEICHMIQEQEWELEAPYPELMGPYTYKGNQWVGFDDEDIILEKAKFIVREKLAGGMVWTLDNDDFRGKCYGERSPLITTLKTALEEGFDTTPEKGGSSSTAPPHKRPSTKKPSTFTTPDPGPPFECEDEGFFNNPADCKKYFWCLDSGPSNLGLVAHSFTCPSGLFFNKQRDSCDYAANVVCRVKKTTASATSTTPRARLRPKKKTTTATSTTSTTTPPKKKIGEDIQGENLADILQLLQQLGLNQIQGRLQGRESTANQTLPEYRTVDRGRQVVREDPFLQYAQPDRGNPKTRGPQYRVSGATEEPASRPDQSAPEVDDGGAEEKGGDFPFVYHTPSRQRSRTTPGDSDEEDGDDDVDTTTSSPKSRPTQVVRPVTQKPGAQRRRHYVLAKSSTEKEEPNVLEEEERTTPLYEKPARRRARPVTRKSTTTSTTPPPRKELIVLPSGKKAVPATTRRYRAPLPQSRGPALALLADGGITCLRRGVHPHPKDCSKFIVCVPSLDPGGDLDGFIHDCPEDTYFMEDKGRCMPGDRAQCPTIK